MRKTKPWLLAIAMLWGSLTASAEVVDGINYSFDSSSLTAEVIPYSQNYSGDIVIPESVTYNGNEYRVTSIEERAFCYCSSLTSIEIPNSVTSIEGSTFLECSSLTSINIPNSVTSIEVYAFSGCSSLKKVTLGSGLTSIGSGVFRYCSSLNTIKVDAANTAFCVEEGALYNITKSELICYSAARRNTSFNIPNSVTEIHDYAFYSANYLTDIIVGNGITNIGNYIFSNCSSLQNIELPNSITSIGNYAFFACSSLKSIELPNSVTIIHNSAFQESGLTNITIPNNVSKIGDWAFYGCSSLINLKIPGSVTNIGNSAFSSCYNIQRLILEEGIKSIPGGVFYGSYNLRFLDLPSTITSIGTNAFVRPADSLIVRSSTPPTIWETSFGSGAPYESCTVYVPAESLEDYMEDYDWGYYFSKFAPIEGGEAVNTFPITISSVGYATYYGDSPIQVPTGMTAYYGKLSDDNQWLNLYELSEGKVPAKCGVVLKADPGTYSCIILEESVPTISGNALFGYTTEVDAFILTGIGFNLYTLAQEDGVVGFYKYTGSKLLPNKAFLRLDSSLSAPKMRIMGSETGITEIERESAADAPAIYDLQGHRVSDMSRKGIYVVEGKKVIVK